MQLFQLIIICSKCIIKQVQNDVFNMYTFSDSDTGMSTSLESVLTNFPLVPKPSSNDVRARLDELLLPFESLLQVKLELIRVLSMLLAGGPRPSISGFPPQLLQDAVGAILLLNPRVEADFHTRANVQVNTKSFL